MNSINKVVILGGTGFHGSQILKTAKERGYDVRSISRGEGTDIRDYAQFSAKLKEIQPDAIINCAGHEGSIHYVNEHAAEVASDTFQMALNIYRAAAEACPKAVIVNALGNCSYPGDATVAKESEWLSGPVHETVLASGTEKRVRYVLAESFYKQRGVKSVNWLTANCYGIGAGTDTNKLHALNGIIVRLITAQKNGDKEFEIWGTGRPIREWVYIEDVAKMFVDSVEMAEQIYPVNFAQNKGYSIKEIAEMAARELNYPVKFVFNTSKPDGAPIKILDDTKFRAKFPDFRFTPIERGIKKTVEYYKKIL